MNQHEIGRDQIHINAVLPQTGAAIGAGAPVNMGKLNKLEVLVTLAYGADVDCIITFYECDNVAKDNPVLMTAEFQILANTDVSLTEAFTRQTAAANYTIDTGAGKSQKVKFTIYPAQMSAGKPVLYPNIGNSDAANIIAADYFAWPKYGNDVSLLTD
jgi:hypothetical protein